MANDENNPKNSPEVQELEQQLREANEALSASQVELDQARSERLDAVGREEKAVKREREARARETDAVSRAQDAEATVKEGMEAALLEAEKARKKAEKATQQAEAERQRAETAIENQQLADKRFDAEQKAIRGLRDFVRDSLSDIMTGVDDAAIVASSRQLTDGLTEGGLVAPSRVGTQVGSTRESLVEFDVAVIGGEQQSKKDVKSAEANLKLSLMKVVPLGFSAGAGRRQTRSSEERSEISRHNRIRFSVPVVFAYQDHPLE